MIHQQPGTHALSGTVDIYSARLELYISEYQDRDVNARCCVCHKSKNRFTAEQLDGSIVAYFAYKPSENSGSIGRVSKNWHTRGQSSL
jgi:hypothetical protein